MRSLLRKVRSAVAANRHKLELAIVFLIVLVAAAPWHAVFDDWTYLAVIAGAVLLAILISALGAMVRLPWWGTAGIGLVALVLLIGEAVYPGEALYGVPLPAMFRATFDGLTGSWVAVLSAGRPADPIGDNIVLPIVISFVAAYVASELVLRTRWVAVPALPPLIAFGLALAFAGSARTASLLVALALVAGVIGLIYRRANPARDPTVREEGRRRIRWRVEPKTAALLLGLLAAGVVAGWFLPVVQGKPRGLDYKKPLDIDEGVSPLTLLHADPKDTSNDIAFRVTFDEVPPGLKRVPIAELESYDGAVWGTGAQFARVGRRVPRAVNPSSLPTTKVRQHYLLGDWNSPFVPALERPVGVIDGGDNLGVDPSTGMLARVPDAPAATEYVIDSEVASAPSKEQLAAARSAPRQKALEPYLTPPTDIPPEFKDWVATVVDKDAPQHPDESLTAVATNLRDKDDHRFSNNASPGHSLGRLVQLVRKENAPDAASLLGTSEQYAAAFALVARMIGFPSRVVVGYNLGATPSAREKVDVHKNQVVAWPEVYLDQLGWVSYDPLPKSTREPSDKVQPAVPPPTIDEPAADKRIGEACAQNCTPIPAAATSSTTSFAWLLLIPLLAIAALLAILLARAVRRRRRKSSRDPAARIVGAWHESSDRLVAYGLAPRRAAVTPLEMAEIVGERAPGAAASLEEMSPLVDVALYSPDPPEHSLANESWAAERSVRREAARVVPLGTRVRAAVDPRPLLPRRRHRVVEPPREPELV